MATGVLFPALVWRQYRILEPVTPAILDQFWEQIREWQPKFKENGVSRLFYSDILVKLSCSVDGFS